MEKNKVFYSANFLNSVEEIKKVKLNGYQKTILSLFNSEGILYLNSNAIKALNTSKNSLVYKLNNLIKMGIISKAETNVYKLDSSISKKFDKHNGFYIECDLFRNTNLPPYSVILYSFFKVYGKDGFLMNTKTINKYLGFSKPTLYNSIDSLKENGLIKIEKSKFKNRFRYFTLPYTVEDYPNEEIVENVEIEPKETTTIPTVDNEELIMLREENERLQARIDKAINEYKKLKQERDNIIQQYNDLVNKYNSLVQQIKTNQKPQYTPKPQPTKNNTPYNITKRMVETTRELSKLVMCECSFNENYNNNAYQDLYNYLSTVQVDENLKNEEFNHECYTFKEDIAKQEGMKYTVHYAGETVKRSLKQIIENKDRCQQQEIVTKLEGYYNRLIINNNKKIKQ